MFTSQTKIIARLCVCVTQSLLIKNYWIRMELEFLGSNLGEDFDFEPAAKHRTDLVK